MKKNLTLSVLVLFMICARVQAALVTVTDAQQVALNFFKLNTTVDPHIALTASLIYTQTESDNTVDFYVFNISPAKGFVIVAADDNVKPILAYSTESNFNANYKRIGLNHWVYKTAANIDVALQHHVVADAVISGQWMAYRQGQNPNTEKTTWVGPLVTTTWDQENDVDSAPPPYLYNLLCPYIATDQQRCLTGCVATSFAQILKYWNYPAVGKGSYSYHDGGHNYQNNIGTLTANFAHTFQWALMPPVLTGNEPLAQDSAVDVLMYDCGVAVAMDYGDDNQGGSGAESLLMNVLPDSACTQYALVNYFSYNPDTIKGVLESSYNANSWVALIEHQLNMGRPVIYEGDDPTQGGHAWVCDGYNSYNYVHMNWGWSDFDNGWFAINNLTTAGDFNPIEDDDALIGIVPLYPNPPLTNFGAILASSCSGTVQFNDFSHQLPTSWLWSFGDGVTSALQNPVHTYSSNGTYTVSLVTTNPAGSDTLTMANYITIDMLPAPTANNVSGTGAQSFSLSATASTTVGWFDSAGAILSSANPFVTPVLSNTTTYWVEDSIPSPAAGVGPAQNQPDGGAYLPDPFAVRFYALKTCIIQSVYVYSETASNRNIQVLDSLNNVVAQNTVYCPAGGSRLTLNLAIDSGGPYFMQNGELGDSVGLWRDSMGATYPYTDSLGLISITGNTAYAPDYYYYFFDWIVSAPSCVSPRVAVTATVLSTGIANVNSNVSFNMYPNPASNDVLLQTGETGNEFSWSLKNILGQTLINQTTNAAQTHLNLSGLASGVYLVELKAGDKSAVQKLVISH